MRTRTPGCNTTPVFDAGCHPCSGSFQVPPSGPQLFTSRGDSAASTPLGVLVQMLTVGWRCEPTV